MKVKEEEQKRQKAKKDTVDDQRKGDDGDKQNKDGGEDKAKKGDGDKRKRKDDDYIAGEELEQQITAEVDRQRRQEQTMEEDRGQREDLPGDTLEYVQDEDEDYADHAAVEEEVDDNDNTAVEEEVDDNDADGDDDEKREELKPFNFEEEMGTLCKRFQLCHAHRAEEQLRTDRMIRAFRKKKKWLNWRAEKEAEQKQAMAQKFEDLCLCLQEEAEMHRLKVAQELRKEEERKLEEIVKQLSAEHGVAEEDIRLQMQAVQDIVRVEVEKKVEKERMEEEKRRSEEIAREREEAEEKRRREEIEKMVRQREEEEREQNWAEKEELGLKAMEIEMQIGWEDADAMAWEDEVERHFEQEMSIVCERYELWHEIGGRGGGK